MNSITLAPGLRKVLGDLDDAVTILDENGQPVGRFLPIGDYKTLLRNQEIPASPDELDRRFREEEGRPLAEIWKELAVRDHPPLAEPG